PIRSLDAAPASVRDRPRVPVPCRGPHVANPECADDSGDAWLSAGRFYVYPGTRQEVLDHYRKAAEADGWRFEPQPVAGHGSMGSCFTRGEDGRAKQLALRFVGAEEISEFYGREAGLEFASGAGFGIEVGSAADGAGGDATSC
ncbi:hypothetical protein ACWGA0_38925, partial [Streptomyces erythrochromogenes]